MKYPVLVLLAAFILLTFSGWGQTPVPNNDFEEWNTFLNYEDPVGWDTPNEELSSIPLYGTTVVTKSADHYSGSYSARLESKEMVLVGGVPGFMTCGKLTINMSTFTFDISGGVPIDDMPTHLFGYYKFFPKGGDSCAIGIGLFRTYDSIPVEIGLGHFSTSDSVPDWTFFSARIDYDSLVQPDTMNIIVLSSAMQSPTPGTVLFVDDLSLDYSVGTNPADPASGIHSYNDLETGRLLVFLDFQHQEETRVTLYNIMGKPLVMLPEERIRSGKREIIYTGFTQGIYILEVEHDGKRVVKKYFLDPGW